MASLPKPVNVSPVIKGVRWTLLIVGMLYGSNKKTLLTAFEKKEKVRRKELYHKHRLEVAAASKKEYIEMVLSLCKDMEVKTPPGWTPPY